MWGTWGVGGVRCRMKSSKSEGEAPGYFKMDTGCTWVVVLWDGDKTPVCVPASKLLFKHIGQPFRPEPNL